MDPITQATIGTVPASILCRRAGDSYIVGAVRTLSLIEPVHRAGAAVELFDEASARDELPAGSPKLPMSSASAISRQATSTSYAPSPTGWATCAT